MKKNIFMMLLFVAASVEAVWSQSMRVWKNGEYITYKISKVDSMQVVTEPVSSVDDYVDLGLPSGTLWATCNVGAASPEQYGDYFAWGETTAAKSEYAWTNYLWMRPGGTSWTDISKYTFEDDQMSGCWYSGQTFVGDGETEFFPEDDAAFVNLGSDWRTPSSEQFVELIDERYTTTTWTTQNGVNGLLVTSKANGKSIFLPAAGERFDAELAFDGTYAFYWARSLSESYSDQGALLFFFDGNVGVTGANRCLGHCIRPVRNRR